MTLSSGGESAKM